MSGARPTAASSVPVAPGSAAQQSGLVKICGLRQPEDAVAAARGGADLIGFIFVPSRRQVTPEAARKAIAAARAAVPDRPVLAVGVFVDADAAAINQVARIAGLDLVQLHGNEPPAMLGLLDLPLVKVIRPLPGATGDEVAAVIRRYDGVANAPVRYQIEGYSPTASGGAGVQGDWSLAQSIAADWPVSLAGGLSPANVSEAIAITRPLAVDTSSGVERHGVKAPDLIAAFIGSARQAFAAL